MASFSICPLIDQNSFLGISDDSTPGCIIVSLGKKMIIRFRLSDQKQLSSWTTKDKLTTPVYYDDLREEYFAIFNGEMLSKWPQNKKNLSMNTGKYKLDGIIDSIHCLHGIRPVLLFRSGVLAFLGTEKKKSINILSNNALPKETIIETKAFGFSNRHYLCFLVKVKNKCILKFSPISESNDGAFEIDVVKVGNDSKLNCFTVLEDKGYLMTLWSDGCLHQYDLNQTSRNSEDFPGRCITTITDINCATPCVILSIDDHIAIYGADSKGEGAKILWVDATFGIVQNSLYLKLYSNPPRMWKVCSSYLITLVGQNLTVIPSRLKSVPKLASLLAAHCPTKSNITHVSWENVNSNVSRSEEANNIISNKLKDGFPEYLLSRELIDKDLEEGNLKNVLKHLNNLTDIPDTCIVDTIVSCLASFDETHSELLFKVLSFPLLGDSDTLMYIRDKLPFESVVLLLSAIASRLSSDYGNISLLKWATLLLDSHYQQCLLIKDDSVLKQLSCLKEQIDTQIMDMTELQELYKLLTGTLNTKVTTKSVVHYTIDKFTLY